MDVKISIEETEEGYLVNASIAGEELRIGVSHPEFEKAWDIVSSYVISAVEKVEKGK